MANELRPYKSKDKKDRDITFALILMLFSITFLCMCSLASLFGTSIGHMLPVTIQSTFVADYSASNNELLIQPLNIDIIGEVLRDDDYSENLDMRLETLRNNLLSPVPSITPVIDNEVLVEMIDTEVSVTINPTPETPPSILSVTPASTRDITPSQTATATPTFTETIQSSELTQTLTATGTSTSEEAVTDLSIGNTATAIPNTLIPLSTETELSVIVIASPTPLPALTPLPSATFTASATSTTILTPSVTNTATMTSTATSSPTATFTASWTPTATSTATSTTTPAATSTNTATVTATSTNTATVTPSPTNTLTSTATLTATATSTATNTATVTYTPSPSPTTPGCSAPINNGDPGPPVNGFVLLTSPEHTATGVSTLITSFTVQFNQPMRNDGGAGSLSGRYFELERVDDGKRVAITAILYNPLTYVATLIFDNTHPNWTSGSSYIIRIRSVLQNACLVRQNVDVESIFQTN